MDCIPIRSVQGLVATLLAESGASKAVQQKALGLASEIEFISGQVVLVSSESGQRSITVIARGRNPQGLNVATFQFPPNGSPDEEELIRAQDSGLIVAVVFRVNGQKLNIIHSIGVYAGVSGGARY